MMGLQFRLGRLTALAPTGQAVAHQAVAEAPVVELETQDWWVPEEPAQYRPVMGPAVALGPKERGHWQE